MKRLIIIFIMLASVAVAQMPPQVMNWYKQVSYRPSIASQVAGSALFFAGTASSPTGRVALSTTSSFKGSSNMTFSAWVWLADYNTFTYLFSEVLSSGSGRFGVGFENTTGKMRTFWRDKNNEAGGATVILSPFAVPMSNWVHVCYTWSSVTDTHQFYTNGILSSNVSSAVAELGTANPLTTTIAGYSGSVGTYLFPFSGRIDEFNAWQRVLASNEVFELYNSGSGTYLTNTGTFASSGLAYTNSARLVFHFDENTGTNVTDHSGNNFNGSTANATWTNGIVRLP